MAYISSRHAMIVLVAAAGLVQQAEADGEEMTSEVNTHLMMTLMTLPPYDLPKVKYSI